VIDVGKQFTETEATIGLDGILPPPPLEPPPQPAIIAKARSMSLRHGSFLLSASKISSYSFEHLTILLSSPALAGVF
jgi:hypothetical protein